LLTLLVWRKKNHFSKINLNQTCTQYTFACVHDNRYLKFNSSTVNFFIGSSLSPLILFLKAANLEILPWWTEFLILQFYIFPFVFLKCLYFILLKDTLILYKWDSWNLIVFTENTCSEGLQYVALSGENSSEVCVPFSCKT